MNFISGGDLIMLKYSMGSYYVCLQFGYTNQDVYGLGH